MNGKPKSRRWRNKYEEIAADVEIKEAQLKELNEKESQEDNKAFKRNKGDNNASEPAAEPKARPIRANSRARNDSQFHLIHLLIAVFTGFIVGIIISKFVF